jgi:hypothetical protein
VAGWFEVYNHGPDLAYPPLLDYLLEQIKGMDPLRPTAVNQFLRQSCRFPQAKPLACRSTSCSAAWSAIGNRTRFGLVARACGNRGRRSNSATRSPRTSRCSWRSPDPYLPVDGHLELRPDKPGWGVTIDENALASDDWVSWSRRVPVRPDGSTAWM